MNIEPDKKSQEGEWQGKTSLNAKRKIYRKLKKEGAVADAHMILVSPHWSAVKRNLLFALWHLWRANTHARIAWDAYLKNARTPNAVLATSGAMNVLATVFLRSPKPWRDIRRAKMIVGAVLNPDNSWIGMMPAHDLALFYVLEGEILHHERRARSLVVTSYERALALEPLILKETNAKIARPQLSRILSYVGIYFIDNFSPESAKAKMGWNLLFRASALAAFYSRDQEKKIDRLISARKHKRSLL